MTNTKNGDRGDRASILWAQFTQTGRIGVYLAYRAMTEHERKAGKLPD